MGQRKNLESGHLGDSQSDDDSSLHELSFLGFHPGRTPFPVRGTRRRNQGGVLFKGGREGGYWEEMKSNSEQELRMKNCVSDGLRRRPVECNRAGG